MAGSGRDSCEHAGVLDATEPDWTGRPAVSVLIPAHNAARTLAATLSSLARQTLEDWEAVIRRRRLER